MKYRSFIILLIAVFISCRQSPRLAAKTAFTAFDFSYDATFSTSFSIKFTQGDTVYVNQRFTKGDTGILKNNTTYYAVVDDLNRYRLDSFLNNIDFFKYSDKYEQYIMDGVSYQFYIKKGLLTKTIFVLSDSVPPALETFARWIAAFKSKLALVRVDTTIEFVSSKYIFPAELQAPRVIFKPPGQH